MALSIVQHGVFLMERRDTSEQIVHNHFGSVNKVITV